MAGQTQGVSAQAKFSSLLIAGLSHIAGWGKPSLPCSKDRSGVMLARIEEDQAGGPGEGTPSGGCKRGQTLLIALACPSMPSSVEYLPGCIMVPCIMAAPSNHPDHIQKADFLDLLSAYGKTIGAASTSGKSLAPTLVELDGYIFGDLQAAVRIRWRKGQPYLELEEVGKCIQWKLKHGKFRPKLLKMALSNSPENVKEISATALGKLPEQKPPSATAVMEALAEMSKLRGIGPASASLLLSVARPDHIPFFSDEAFQWIMSADSLKGDPWKRTIKYNKQEYLAYLAGVDKVSQRLGVKAFEVERVGWILGTRQADISAPPEEEVAEESD